MFQTILTIISALGAFCAFYLLGSSRQKAKDDRTLKEYRTEAEAVIRTESQKTAEAEAKQAKADVERYLMSKAVDIVTSEPESHNEELRGMAEEAKTETDYLDTLKKMQEDSRRRVEELGRRYEN